MRPSTPEDFAEKVATRPRRGPLGLLFDYDGTLVEIAPRPEDARLSAPVHARLSSLAARDDIRVGIVTGRSLDGLLAVCGHVDGMAVASNGGFRVTDADGDWVHPEARRLVPLMARFAARLAPFVDAHPGTQLEDKTFSLALHYRRAPQFEQALRAEIADCLRDGAGAVRTVEGKAVVELQPAIDWDKGRALEVICDRWGTGESTVFLGDDVIDEPAFASVRRYGGLGCRVAADDAPTHARVRLASVPSVHAFLGRLLERLG
jgi:trehalose 6-phosphate phosphatase